MRTQLHWMRELRDGDVLLSRNGSERVCRRVSRYKNGDLHSVTFSIARCSWTKRCYTVVGYNDLRYMGYHPPHHHVRYKMKTELDAKINACIANPDDWSMKCCDVHGVV